jgi:hypothetical protein
VKNSGFLSTLPEGQFDLHLENLREAPSGASELDFLNENHLESVREGAIAPSDYGVLRIIPR